MPDLLVTRILMWHCRYTYYKFFTSCWGGRCFASEWLKKQAIHVVLSSYELHKWLLKPRISTYQPWTVICYTLVLFLFFLFFFNQTMSQTFIKTSGNSLKLNQKHKTELEYNRFPFMADRWRWLALFGFVGLNYKSQHAFQFVTWLLQSVVVLRTGCLQTTRVSLGL